MLGSWSWQKVSLQRVMAVKVLASSCFKKGANAAAKWMVLAGTYVAVGGYTDSSASRTYSALETSVGHS